MGLFKYILNKLAKKEKYWNSVNFENLLKACYLLPHETVPDLYRKIEIHKNWRLVNFSYKKTF